MSRVVNSCPLRKFISGLSQLHSADDDWQIMAIDSRSRRRRGSGYCKLSVPYSMCESDVVLCVCYQSRMATEAEVLCCHSDDYLHRVRSSAVMTESELEELSTCYDGVYFHPVYYHPVLCLALFYLCKSVSLSVCSLITQERVGQFSPNCQGSSIHTRRRHAAPTQAQVRLHWTAWCSDLSSVNCRSSCLSCCWSKDVE